MDTFAYLERPNVIRDRSTTLMYGRYSDSKIPQHLVGSVEVIAALKLSDVSGPIGKDPVAYPRQSWCPRRVWIATSITLHSKVSICMNVEKKKASH